GDTTPSPADGTAFGATEVSGGTITQTFTINNTGGTTLNLSSISITGPNSGDFGLASVPPGLIAPSSSVTFDVIFNPSAGGRRAATVTVVSDDADETTYDFAISGSGSLATGGTTLAAGDVAFVGYNADNNEFGFALLKDIVAGTVIKFTDAGWTGTQFRNSSEGAIQWTAPADMTAGTVVIPDESTESWGLDFQATTEGGFFSNTFDPGTAGDTIIAYQGTASSSTSTYTNLAAIHYDGPVFDSGATSTSESAVPAGLTDGVNAISFGKSPDGDFDSGVWTVSIQPTIDALRAAINNESNWVGSDDAGGQVIPTGPFVLGVAEPEISLDGNNLLIADGDTE
ncbi:choice-of-anchor D domain-containing protein, partial [Cribrihabitans sp. XS_ASV171]